MANRVIIGLAALGALALAFVPDVDSSGVVGLVMVVLGLAYGAMAVDAEDAGGYMITALAVGAAAGADVLGGIPGIGAQLDAVVDGLSTVLTAGVVSVLAVWTVNRVKG